MRISVSRRSEFCVYRAKNKNNWYVKFWDDKKNVYACRRSTGVPLDKPRGVAEKAARELLKAGVLASADTTGAGFIAYLQNFWALDGDYCRAAAKVKGKPIAPDYVRHNLGDIRLHIATYPPFKKLLLSDLTTGDLERWQLWTREDHGISGNRANHCLKLIKTALAQAAKRGDLPADPSKVIARAAHNTPEKGILTAAEAAAVCALPPDNPRRLLPVLLGLCCGMRRGEVRGLQWGDIQDGMIDIRHNWIDGEGLKAPKSGSARQVPYGAAVAACLDAVKATARHVDPGAFVLESLRTDGKPVKDEFPNKALKAVLVKIGIPGEWTGKDDPPEGYVNEQRRRNLTFHGLRHTFISLARLAGIDDLTVQTLAGHSSLSMTDHYTHAAQAIDFTAARDKLAGVWARKGA
jgi:integrase